MVVVDVILSKPAYFCGEYFRCLICFSSTEVNQSSTALRYLNTSNNIPIGIVSAQISGVVKHSKQAQINSSSRFWNALSFTKANEVQISTNHLFVSDPCIICIDLTVSQILKAGRPIYYTYECLIPPFLPPSFNGSHVKYNYSLQLTIQPLTPKEPTSPIVMNVPFSLLGAKLSDLGIPIMRGTFESKPILPIPGGALEPSNNQDMISSGGRTRNVELYGKNDSKNDSNIFIKTQIDDLTEENDNTDEIPIHLGASANDILRITMKNTLIKQKKLHLLQDEKLNIQKPQKDFHQFLSVPAKDNFKRKPQAHSTSTVVDNGEDDSMCSEQQANTHLNAHSENLPSIIVQHQSQSIMDHCNSAENPERVIDSMNINKYAIEEDPESFLDNILETISNIHPYRGFKGTIGDNINVNSSPTKLTPLNSSTNIILSGQRNSRQKNNDQKSSFSTTTTTTAANPQLSINTTGISTTSSATTTSFVSSANSRVSMSFNSRSFSAPSSQFAPFTGRSGCLAAVGSSPVVDLDSHLGVSHSVLMKPINATVEVAALCSRVGRRVKKIENVLHQEECYINKKGLKEREKIQRVGTLSGLLGGSNAEFEDKFKRTRRELLIKHYESSNPFFKSQMDQIRIQNQQQQHPLLASSYIPSSIMNSNSGSLGLSSVHRYSSSTFDHSATLSNNQQQPQQIIGGGTFIKPNFTENSLGGNRDVGSTSSSPLGMIRVAERADGLLMGELQSDGLFDFHTTNQSEKGRQNFEGAKKNNTENIQKDRNDYENEDEHDDDSAQPFNSMQTPSIALASFHDLQALSTANAKELTTLRSNGIPMCSIMTPRKVTFQDQCSGSLPVSLSVGYVPVLAGRDLHIVIQPLRPPAWMEPQPRTVEESAGDAANLDANENASCRVVEAEIEFAMIQTAKARLDKITGSISTPLRIDECFLPSTSRGSSLTNSALTSVGGSFRSLHDSAGGLSGFQHGTASEDSGFANDSVVLDGSGQVIRTRLFAVRTTVANYVSAAVTIPIPPLCTPSFSSDLVSISHELTIRLICAKNLKPKSFVHSPDALYGDARRLPISDPTFAEIIGHAAPGGAANISANTFESFAHAVPVLVLPPPSIPRTTLGASMTLFGDHISAGDRDQSVDDLLMPAPYLYGGSRCNNSSNNKNARKVVREDWIPGGARDKLLGVGNTRADEEMRVRDAVERQQKMIDEQKRFFNLMLLQANLNRGSDTEIQSGIDVRELNSEDIELQNNAIKNIIEQYKHYVHDADYKSIVHNFRDLGMDSHLNKNKSSENNRDEGDDEQKIQIGGGIFSFDAAAILGCAFGHKQRKTLLLS